MNKAIIKHDRKGMTVFCNMGHLLEYYNFNNMVFAGSSLEAENTERFDRMAARCQGFGHEVKA